MRSSSRGRTPARTPNAAVQARIERIHSARSLSRGPSAPRGVTVATPPAETLSPVVAARVASILRARAASQTPPPPISLVGVKPTPRPAASMGTVPVAASKPVRRTGPSISGGTPGRPAKPSLGGVVPHPAVPPPQAAAPAAPRPRASRGASSSRASSTARLVRVLLYGLAAALSVGAFTFVAEGLTGKELLNNNLEGKPACALALKGAPVRTAAMPLALTAPGQKGGALTVGSGGGAVCAWKPVLEGNSMLSPLQLLRVTVLSPALLLEAAVAHVGGCGATAARYAGALEWAFLGGVLLSVFA